LTCGTANAACVTDVTTSISFCVCLGAWSGPNCDVVDTKCASVTCSDPNAGCVDGVCLCKDGYLPGCPYTPGVPPSGAACACVPIGAGPCETASPCTGNYQCLANAAGAALCVCPYLTFGGAACNKPRCNVNSDCFGEFGTHAYCVNNTQPTVAPFCQCPYGTTGLGCSSVANCTNSGCGNGRVCTNEGRCACPAGFVGPNCNQTSVCRTYELFLKYPSMAQAATSAEIQVALCSFVQIDASAIAVVGPKSTASSTIFEYDISFCDTPDVSGAACYNSFSKNADNSGLPVSSSPSTTGSSDATTVVASFVTIAALSAATLL